MAHIKISHEGTVGSVEVDGVPLKGCVAGAVATLDTRGLPVVELRLVATESTFSFENGVLEIVDMQAPVEVEKALLAYLSQKHRPAVA